MQGQEITSKNTWQGSKSEEERVHHTGSDLELT